MTFLIVGLGNPEEEGYKGTRHNVGVGTVKVLGDLFGRNADAFGDWKKRDEFKAMINEGKIGDDKVILMLPLTYMNDSGDAVQPAAAFWKVPLQHTLVIYDDKDLPLGTLRLRQDGSAGGHNGMRSVIERLGTAAVPRLRVGIGAPQDGPHGSKIATADYVLGKFSPAERKVIENTMQRAATAAETFIKEGIEAAMNKFNE